MPSSGLYKVLGDITCVHIENSKVTSCKHHNSSTLSDLYSWEELKSLVRGGDSLLSRLQIPHIESLIRDRSDHIDWRRLLLSAALPWPSPSMPQLLAALEGFKAVDPDLTGYVNEDEYLQVCYTMPVRDVIPKSLRCSQRVLTVFLNLQVELWLSDGAEDAERDSTEIPQSKRLAELRKVTDTHLRINMYFLSYFFS